MAKMNPTQIRKVLQLSADSSDAEVRSTLEVVRTKAEAERATLPPPDDR